MIDIQKLPLIPWPRKIENSGGTVALTPGVIRDEFTARGGQRQQCDHAVAVLSRELAETIRTATGLQWSITAQAQTADAGDEPTITLSYNSQFAPRSVHMTVSRETLIEASDIEGLRSGVQTLRQLIMACGGVLPELEIEDRPDYAQRGYLLDTTRGRVPTLKWLQHWADELELHKYTSLQLYVEDSFAFPGMRSVWAGTDPLTAEEITAFDRYCADRGIELIPCLATFGHLYSVLRAEPFRELGEFPEDADRPFSFIERQEHHTLNITADGAFDLSRHLIDSVVPLFQSQKVNICGDETFDLGKGRSSQQAQKTGIQQMYADYVNRLCVYVRQTGREPLMWGDIVLQHPEIMTQLTGRPLFLNWQYSPEVTEQSVIQLQQAGARQWVCAATHAWNSLLPSYSRAWKNISRLALFGIRHHAEGFVITDWGDFGHINDPRMSEPAMLMGAEYAWNARKQTSREQLFVRIDQSLFRSGDAVIAAVEKIVSSQMWFSWADAVCMTELDGGNGRLNHDVAQYVAGSHPSDPAFRAIPGAESAQEAQRLYMRGLASQHSKLSELSAQMAAKDMEDTGNIDCVTRMETAVAQSCADREMTHALIVAAWGQDLLNRCGQLLVQLSLPSTGDLSSNAHLASALYADLLRWYEEYRAVWLTSSRSSQIFRIRDVVNKLSALLMR
jgi:hypothetical protein